MGPLVPRRLKGMAKKVRVLLSSEEEVVVYHDGDADGIISAAILEDFLEERGVGFVAFSRGREHTPFTEWDRFVVLDIGFDRAMKEDAEQNGVRVYYVDHHEPETLPRNTSILNPWFTRIKLVPPHRYNTGLLAWLLEGMNRENAWKAALSNYADGSVDIHTRKWVERLFGGRWEELSTASRLVNTAMYFPDIRGDDIRELVRRATSLDDILRCEWLLRRKEELDREIDKLASRIRELAHREKVVYLVLPELTLRIVGVATTRVSFEFRDKAFIVGYIDGDRIRYMLRFQNAEKYGVHLGEIAKEAGKRFGGNGGGHPPAAGLRIPREKEPEFREWVLKKLASLL